MLAAKLEAIHNAGYPVTLAELDKWYPQTSEGVNSAGLFGAAFAKLANGKAPAPLASNDLANLFQQATALSPAMKQAVADCLSSNAEAITILHEAASRTQSRYPLDLSRLSLLPYPHLMNLHRSAYLLELEAIDRANGEKPELAARSLDSLLGLARSLATEPLVRSHLVRIECQKIALTSTQHVLNRATLTDAQLAGLGAALDMAGNSYSLSRAFAGQRCIGIYSFDMMEDTVSLWRMPVWRRWPWWQRAVVKLTMAFTSSGWLYEASGLMQWDELCYLQLMDQYVNAAGTDFPNRLAAARSLQQAVRRLPKFHVLTGPWLRAMNGTSIILKDATTVARLRAARTAIAIERYRLAHDELPESLAALTPTYLKTVPIDPFDGQPLRWKKLPVGYVVYSVGEDGRDDGGDEVKDIAFTVAR